MAALGERPPGSRPPLPRRLRPPRAALPHHQASAAPRSGACSGWQGEGRRAAARRARVSGSFSLRSVDDAPPRRAVRLPCFEGATSICVVGFLRLAVPPVGMFTRLTDLVLERIRFCGPPSALGDAVSSKRCPSLWRFEVTETVGLTRLAIRSHSLLEVELQELLGLRELTMDAPELRELSVASCFGDIEGDLVVTIRAPELVFLNWDDMSSQENVNFLIGMPHIRFLGNLSFLVYADHEGFAHNRACLELLKAYKVIKSVRLTLTCLIDGYKRLSEPDGRHESAP